MNSVPDVKNAQKYYQNILNQLSEKIGWNGKPIFFAKVSLKEDPSIPPAGCVRKLVFPIKPSDDTKRPGHITILLSCIQPEYADANILYLAGALVDSLAAYLQDIYTLKPFFPSDYKIASPQGQILDETQIAAAIYEETAKTLSAVWSRVLNVPLELIDSLSMSWYESKAASGSLVVAHSDQLKKLKRDCIWYLDSEVPFEQNTIRHLRKLLTGAGKNFLACAIVAGKLCCIGVIGAKEAEKYPFRIKIVKPMTWELFRQNQIILQRAFSGFRVTDLSCRLREAVHAEFGDRDCTDLLRTLKLLSRQRGAAVIVTDWKTSPSKSQQRIEQLAKHGKAVCVTFDASAYTDSSGAALCAAASMDGAVVVDLKGKILYLAAIVDGITCVEGDLARGARYNSIKNFVIGLARDDNIIGIVLSEDGGADILCGKTFLQELRRENAKFIAAASLQPSKTGV